MKELINKIIHPYKEIKNLEQEIENQDKQYSYLQTRLSREKGRAEEYAEDNSKLARQVETLKQKNKALKKELNEIKTSREDG